MSKFNFFRRVVRRLSGFKTTESTDRKEKPLTGPRISRLSLSKRFRLSSVSRISRLFSGLGKKSTTTNNVRPSSSPPKVSKKSWWSIHPFTKKRSSQNTRSQLECDSTVDNVSTADDDLLTINDDVSTILSTEPFHFTSPTVSITILNELPDQIMSPEYDVTGSTHSYISSSDDECAARIITLPVFSVTQSITDIHNTCILEWNPDHCAEEVESKGLIVQKANTSTIDDEKQITVDNRLKHDPDCVEREESQELTVVARPLLHMQQKDDFTIIKQTIADNVGAELKPDMPTVNTVIISDDKQINDNVMKGEGDKWINEGENEFEVTNTAAIDLAVFLAASFITAIIIIMLMLVLL